MSDLSSYWSRFDLLRVRHRGIAGSPLWILDGFTRWPEEKVILPHRCTQTGMTLWPVRYESECRELAYPQEREGWPGGPYVRANVTLDRYATKIQRQFRESISNPTYCLCRTRLMREFIHLANEK